MSESIDLNNLSEDDEKNVQSILYAIDLIRRETGYGELVIEIRGGKVGDMHATHDIRPKQLKPSS